MPLIRAGMRDMRKQEKMHMVQKKEGKFLS